MCVKLGEGRGVWGRGDARGREGILRPCRPSGSGPKGKASGRKRAPRILLRGRYNRGQIGVRAALPRAGERTAEAPGPRLGRDACFLGVLEGDSLYWGSPGRERARKWLSLLLGHSRSGSMLPGGTLSPGTEGLPTLGTLLESPAEGIIAAGEGTPTPMPWESR